MTKRRLAAVAGAFLLLIVTAQGAGANTPDKPKPNGRVLIISLPEITWSDLTQRDAPTIRGILDQGAVGGLTTRTITRATALTEGYLTVGAGTKAIGTGPTPILLTSKDAGLEVGEKFGTGTAADAYEQRTGQSARQPIVYLGISAAIAAQQEETYDAKIGALGDALKRAGYNSAAIGNADRTPSKSSVPEYERSLVTALMDSHGQLGGGKIGSELIEINVKAPFGLQINIDAAVSAFDNAWKPRSVVLVEGSDLVRVDAFRNVVSPKQILAITRTALRRTDAMVKKMMTKVNLERDTVIIFSPSPPSTTIPLGVAGMAGPGVDAGLLRSATTRRDGFVQLVDIAPTVLTQLGIKVPETMNGKPFTVAQTDMDANARRDFLIDSDQASQFRDSMIAPVATVFIIMIALLVVGAIISLNRPNRNQLRNLLHFGSLFTLGFISAVYLARLFSFHQTSKFFYWLFVVAVAAIIGTISLAFYRRRANDDMLIALGLIVVIIGIDIITGGNLQFNNAFGYSPTVGARFSGIGNIGFSAISASTVIFVGFLVNRLGNERKFSRGVIIAWVILAAVLIIDIAPMFGGDVGGIIAMVPAFGLTAILLLGGRVQLRMRTVVIGALATIGALTIMAAIDLAQPKGERTHLGQLVERVQNEGLGSFSDVVLRKLNKNIATFTGSVWVWMLPIVLGFLIYLALQARPQLRAITARTPELRASFIGFAVLAILGYGFNDSGVIVPGMMLGILGAVIIAQLALTDSSGGLEETLNPESEPLRR